MSIIDKEMSAMVPRVFISSTFYDLKYVRENIGSFVEGYGFTPLISETGNLGYYPLQSLDKSCYAAMSVSNMAILIIGGRYGSPTSDETMSEDVFKQYKSVTRKEFETAVSNNVPIYVFIEAPVYYEYDTYKKNRKRIEEGTLKIDFASVDNLNVFRFVSEIYDVKGIPIWSFSRVEDIKDKLKKQWATLFWQHLTQIKNNASNKRLEDPIKTIDSTIKQMNILMEKLGEKIIGNSPEEKEDVKRKQLIESVAMIICNSFEFCILSNSIIVKDFLDFFVNKLFDACDNNILDSGFSNDSQDLDLFNSHFSYDGVLMTHYDDYLYYNLDVLDKVRNYKDEIVNRLMENDCIVKMKLNKI